MRSVLVCVGIAAAVFAAGCDRSQQKVAEGPALPTPQCKTEQTYNADDFKRMVSAMDRSGDLAAVTKRFAQHRAVIEALLAKRDPELLKRLQPALDTQFSAERLRARTACGFLQVLGDRDGIAALEARSRDPRMHAIGTAIWTRTHAPSEEADEEMTPERKALLRDLSEAMALQQTQANIDSLERDAAAVLATALDPAPSAVNQPSRPDFTPSADEIVDRWLAPALRKIPDDDIAEYLAFAGSRFGGGYYVALSAAYDFQTGEWFTQFSDVLRPFRAPESAVGQQDKDALLADARRSLHEIGTPQAAADAMAKLVQAERLDPSNPDILALIGDAAIKTAPAMPLAQDQLRAVIQTPNYDQADRVLSKALELAPAHVDAHMLLGRLRYLQGNDDEAQRLFDRARELAPDHPSMDYFLGDLAYVKQDYALAARYYQASASKPERLAFTHVNALSHLLMALRRSGRQGEYPRIADAYLARNPDAWNFRFDYADHLLTDEKASADKLLAVIEPVPDTFFQARKLPILSAALVLKASKHVEKKTGVPIREGLSSLQRAIKLNPQPRPLAEAVCRAGVDAKVAQYVVELNQEPKMLASELIVCAMRWRRTPLLQAVSLQAQASMLNQPHPDLYGDTPLCYAAATRNVKAFVALAKLQVNPAQKCRDGSTVAERLQQMAYGNDPSIGQMQGVMKRFYKKA
jgi:Flp pilus assembly protein TadD